jgi:hypothetical protein
MIFAKYPKSQNAKIVDIKSGSEKKSHSFDDKWLSRE